MRLALRKLRLRKRCEAKLSTLPLPEHFSIDGLVENIAGARGQRIRLVPIEERQDIRRACGLRAKLGGTTFVLYRPRPTRRQTEHVILHELVHEWLGHSITLTDEELGQLLPGEQLHDLIQRYGNEVTVQARARYGTAEEQEAEMGAYLIERDVARRKGPMGDDMVSRLEHTLSHPVAPPRSNSRRD